MGIYAAGAIGRDSLWAAVTAQAHKEGVELVALAADKEIDELADRLAFHSSYGHFPGTIEVDSEGLVINDKLVRVFRTRDPADVPWGDLGVDVAIEASGAFRSRTKSQRFLDAGAKRVLISAPSSVEDSADYTVVYGVNHKGLRSDHLVVSNASCTTNVLAPVAHVLNNVFGVECGMVSSVHAETGSQPLLDGYNKRQERSDSPIDNIIITSTGAAKSIGLILPDLDGKLGAASQRVPVRVGSLLILTVMLERPPKGVEEVRKVFEAAAGAGMCGVLGVTQECRLGRVRRDPHSALVIVNKIMVIGKMAQVMAWYDNEWGFSNRMIDVAKLMARQLR